MIISFPSINKNSFSKKVSRGDLPLQSSCKIFILLCTYQADRVPPMFLRHNAYLCSLCSCNDKF
nr:MAG TPA: hypothetical protein [Caudoviricetes sp.]